MKIFFKLLFSLALVCIILLSGGAIFESFVTSKVIEIEVTKIERSLDDEGNVNYFIHTNDEVFENKDNYYQGKSNQENLMKLFEKDKKYKVQVVGYNLDFEIPYFISKQRNIIKIVK